MIKELKKLLFGSILKNMENPQKVQQKVNELNAQETRDGMNNIIPQWIPVQGYFAMTGFMFNGNDGKPGFNPGFGVPIKVFSNTRTGEIKIFSANLFEN